MTTPAQRHEMGVVMDYMVAHQNTIHYGQHRPMRSVSIHTFAALKAAIANGITMDCSESATLICKLAGLHDPNGMNYDGIGNTSIMYSHLRHYWDPEYALVGALVFFGDPRILVSQHVATVRHAGADPLLFSHGTESGPDYIRLSHLKTAFRGNPTFLSIQRL